MKISMYIKDKVNLIVMVVNNLLVARRIALFNSEMNRQKDKGLFFCDMNKVKELKKEREKIKSVIRKNKLSNQPDELLSSLKYKGELEVKKILNKFGDI